MHALVVVQQFTHLTHPDRSYRLSYLLRQFVGKTGKTHNDRKQTKHNRKNKHNSTRGKHFSLFRKAMVPCDRPRSNCLLCWVEAVFRCCRPIGSLANSPRAPGCTFEVVDSPLLSTPTSDLDRIHSCSVPVKLKKPPMLVSRGKSSSSSVDVSNRDTPGPSDAVRIAGDRGASRQWITLRRRGLREDDFHPHSLDVHFHFKCKFGRGMGVPRNDHVSIEELIWDGAGTGARALFIHFGGRLNTVEAELSLPGLMLLVHQQTTHLPSWCVAASSLTRTLLAKTPTRCFYFSNHFCEIVLFDSH